MVKKIIKTNKFSIWAIVSLILSIVSILILPTIFSFYGYFTAILAIISIIFGIVALIEIKHKNKRGKGLAITGIIFSLLAIFLALMLFSTLGAIFSS